MFCQCVFQSPIQTSTARSHMFLAGVEQKKVSGKLLATYVLHRKYLAKISWLMLLLPEKLYIICLLWKITLDSCNFLNSLYRTSSSVFNFLVSLSGFSFTGGPTSDILQYVAVPVINNTECQQMYSTLRGMIQANQICAGYPFGQKDACEVSDNNLCLLISKHAFKKNYKTNICFICENKSSSTSILNDNHPVPSLQSCCSSLCAAKCFMSSKYSFLYRNNRTAGNKMLTYSSRHWFSHNAYRDNAHDFSLSLPSTRTRITSAANSIWKTPSSILFIFLTWEHFLTLLHDLW